jgi:LmbE family N-acetylglucosaminyl deacetylase
LTNVFCVRAEFGTYAKHFAAGVYVTIGWMSHTELSEIAARDTFLPKLISGELRVKHSERLVAGAP